MPPEESLDAGQRTDAPVFRMLRRAELSDADIEELAALLEASFPQWPGRQTGVPAVDHLRWKLEGADEDEAAILGRLGNELAVGQTVWNQEFLLNGRSTRRIAFNDLAVSPRHRGQGLSSIHNRFKDDLLSRCEFIHLTATKQPALFGQWQRRGLTQLGSTVSLLLRPLAGSGLRTPMVRSAAGLVLGVLLRSFARLGAWVHRVGLPADGSVTIRSIDRFDASFDAFLARALAPFELVISRSARHLNWRYMDPRAGAFEARAAFAANGDLLGYAVTSPTAPLAALADLLVEPGRPDVAAALADDAANLCQEREGIAALECWLPPLHPTYRALRSRRFAPVRRRLILHYRTVGVDKKLAALFAKPDVTLHYMLGDTDII
ncbi:MAG: hypothetical protein VYE73_11855 [Acidobacteriota bacterium]|nr:hypothetical protein [Acidobacteriota bacterium]